MRFDPDIWKDFKITEERPIGWKCGQCFNGQLLLDVKRIIHSKGDRFGGLLTCTNPKCNYEYSCAGVYKFYSGYVGFEVNRNYVGKKHRQYHPLFFSKAIRFFKLPKELNELSTREFDYAFGHFWNDYAACASAQRRSLEILLDQIKAPEHKNLHQRIVGFQSLNDDVASKLMSVKHIGNAGSHKDKPTREDLLDGFDILDYCLNELFPDMERHERISKISKEINDKQNLRSKSK
jgi:hypothetical protein